MMAGFGPTIRFAHLDGPYAGKECTLEDHCPECAKRFMRTKSVGAPARAAAEADVARFLGTLSEPSRSGKSRTLATFRGRVMDIIATRVAARIVAQRLRDNGPRVLTPSAYASWYRREG